MTYKKSIIIATTLSFLFFAGQTYAAVSPTPAPKDNSTSTKLDKQINQLKDKIASRVSELNLVEKRGLIGTVQDVKGNQITISDISGNVQFIDVDEITKFSSPSKSTLGLSSITKGVQISALGLYNKESKRTLARFVHIQVIPARYTGTIASLDGKNFILTMTTEDQKTVKVNVDTTTKVLTYTKGSDLAKSGFSKLAVGDRIAVVGYPDKKDPTLLNADRVIDYVGIAKNPNVTVVTPTPGTTIAPTSTGAKKLNPIK